MKKNRLKVSDLYTLTNIMTSGYHSIFYFLAQVEDLEDFISDGEDGNLQTLDQDYYIGYSADKFISPFVEKLFNSGKTPVEISEYVANICINRFKTKWKKIYDALLTEYKPLENYSMEETRTPDLTFEETQNEKTDVTTERETHATNSYKGFNANDPVVVNKTDGDEDVTTSGAKLDNEVTKETTHTGTEKLERAGNIGVTTSQQMLESEFKVRQYDFYKMVYNDIDSILCLSVY